VNLGLPAFIIKASEIGEPKEAFVILRDRDKLRKFRSVVVRDSGQSEGPCFPIKRHAIHSDRRFWESDTVPAR